MAAKSRYCVSLTHQPCLPSFSTLRFTNGNSLIDGWIWKENKLAHDHDNYEPALRITEEQVNLAAFVEKARAALDDMSDSFELDETRTEEEWVEELKTVIHNS